MQQHGWYIIIVREDETGPGFAYTIGLSHTYGSPEFAVFGTGIHAMHRILNRLGTEAVAGVVLTDGQKRYDVVDGRPVMLRRVDLRWYQTFFSRAIGFYRWPPSPVLQVAWPDMNDHFHWEEQAEEEHRESQPQLWLPPREHPVGTWTAEL